MALPLLLPAVQAAGGFSLTGALSSVGTFFMGLVSGRNADKNLDLQRELEDKRKQAQLELEHRRSQTQLQLAYLNIKSQAVLELQRENFQEGLEFSRQNFQERMEHLRFGQQMTLEQARQIFQSKLSQLNHERQMEIANFTKSVDLAISQKNLDFQKWRFEQEKSLQEQLAAYNRETQFALAEHHRKTTLDLPEVNKLFENWPLRIVPSQILKSYRGAGAIPLRVIISPPSVDFDRFAGASSQNFPKIEERLAEGLRELLNKHYPLNSTVRPTELLDGAWDSNRFHGGASMRALFDKLKSEPILILDSKADGDYLNLRVAYWGPGQDVYNYEQITRLSYKEILNESAKARALKWKTDVKDKLLKMGKNADEIDKKYGGDNALNLAIMEEDEEFRRNGVEIPRVYKANYEDYDVLCQVLNAYHCIVAGVIADAHHLIHHDVPPILPEVLPDMLAEKPVLPVSDVARWVVANYLDVFRAVEIEKPFWIPDLTLQLAKGLSKLPDKSFAREQVVHSIQERLKLHKLDSQQKDLNYLIDSLEKVLAVSDADYVNKLNQCLSDLGEKCFFSIEKIQERERAEEERKRKKEEEKRHQAELKRQADEEIKKQQYRADGRKIDNGDGTITDYTTGLMWQKSVSDNELNFEKAKAYAQGLNNKRFAGYNDWRIPTIDELKSLITKNKFLNDLFIDPIFDSKQTWCWSSSTQDNKAWSVYFYYGKEYSCNKSYPYYVRAVRNV